MNKWLLLYLGIGAVVILLNLIAWNSTAFCDSYIAWVFPIWVNTYGRVTGMFPFSVGEIMLGLAVGLTVAAILLWILLGIKRLRCLIRGFYLFYAWTFMIVCLIMTLNCFILYHASTFSETYFGEVDEAEFTLEELVAVRNMVVEKCNSMALLMEWGMIRGNDPYLYGEKMKAYLRKGAKPIRGEVRYPNEKVGWGALGVADSIPKE